MMDDGNKKSGDDDDALFGDDEFGDFDEFDDEFEDFDDDLAGGADSATEEAVDVGPDPFTSFEDFEDEDDDGQSDEYAFNVPSTQKTFLQKYFSVIVGLIVLLLGGLWFLAQDFGSDAPAPQGTYADNAAPTPDDGSVPPLENSVPELAQTDGLPPQPAPFQTDTMDEPDAESTAPVEDVPPPAAPEALTPLPGTDGDAVAPKELADLDDVLNQNPMDVRTAVPPTEIDEEALIPNVPAPDPFPAEPLVQAELDVAPAPISSDDDIDNNLDSLEVNAQPEAMAEDMSVDDATDEDEASSEAQDAGLAQQNAALLEEIEANRMALESLRQELKTVQMRLETSKEELKLAEEMAEEEPVVIEKIVDSAPEPEPVEEVKAPAPKKVVSKPKVKAAPKPVWSLRSASPGRATISQKGSNDFVNIEVGSKVAGLGRIQSIQIEDGKWVVRGSSGSVSR